MTRKVTITACTIAAITTLVFLVAGHWGYQSGRIGFALPGSVALVGCDGGNLAISHYCCPSVPPPGGIRPTRGLKTFLPPCHLLRAGNTWSADVRFASKAVCGCRNVSNVFAERLHHQDWWADDYWLCFDTRGPHSALDAVSLVRSFPSDRGLSRSTPPPAATPSRFVRAVRVRSHGKHDRRVLRVRTEGGARLLSAARGRAVVSGCMTD